MISLIENNGKAVVTTVYIVSSMTVILLKGYFRLPFQNLSHSILLMSKLILIEQDYSII